MCGIASIYIHRSKSVSVEGLQRAMVTGLLAIDRRGGHATGYAYIGEHGPHIVTGACDATDFTRYAPAMHELPRAVVMHTRFATTGHPSIANNNHPLQVGSSIVVHNGVLWNDDKVIRDLGYTHRPAEVDSIAIPAALAHAGVGPLSVATALESVRGSLAIASLDTRDPGALTLARGSSSPLYMFNGRAATVAASEPEAVQAMWSALFGGSAPSLKRIECVAEGTVIHMDGKTETRERFTPDNYSTAYSSTADNDWYNWDTYGEYKSYRGTRSPVSSDAGTCAVPQLQLPAGESDRYDAIAHSLIADDPCDMCGLPADATAYERGMRYRVCDSCAGFYAPYGLAVEGGAL